MSEKAQLLERGITHLQRFRAANALDPPVEQWVVSAVVVRQTQSAVNTMNKLYVIHAVSGDEAHGKVLPMAQEDFPEHRLHTICSLRLNDFAPITADLEREAVRIADSCMRSDIECYGCPIGELQDGRYSLVDDAGSEVALIEQACAEIREAFAYLEARGLAELERDEHGHVIKLRLDGFSDPLVGGR